MSRVCRGICGKDFVAFTCRSTEGRSEIQLELALLPRAMKLYTKLRRNPVVYTPVFEERVFR